MKPMLESQRLAQVSPSVHALDKIFTPSLPGPGCSEVGYHDPQDKTLSGG